MKIKSMNIFDELLESYARIKKRKFKIVLSEQGGVANTPEGLYQTSQQALGVFITVPDGQQIPGIEQPKGVPSIRTNEEGTKTSLYLGSQPKGFIPGDETWNNRYLPLFDGGGEEGGVPGEQEALQPTPLMDLLSFLQISVKEKLDKSKVYNDLKKYFTTTAASTAEARVFDSFMRGFSGTTTSYEVEAGKIIKKQLDELSQEELRDRTTFKISIIKSVSDIIDVYKKIGNTEDPITPADIAKVKSLVFRTGTNPDRIYLKSSLDPEYGVLLDSKVQIAFGNLLKSKVDEIFDAGGLSDEEKLLRNYTLENATSAKNTGILAEHIITAVLSNDKSKFKELLISSVEKWKDTDAIIDQFNSQGFLEADTDLVDALIDHEGLQAMGANKVEAFKNFAKTVVRGISTSLNGNIPTHCEAVGTGNEPGRKEDLALYYDDETIAISAAIALGGDKSLVISEKGKFKLLVSLKTYMTNANIVAGNQRGMRPGGILSADPKDTDSLLRKNTFDSLGISDPTRIQALTEFATSHNSKMESLKNFILSNNYKDSKGEIKSTESIRNSLLSSFKDEISKNKSLEEIEESSLISALEAAEKAKGYPSSKEFSMKLFSLIRRHMDTQALQKLRASGQAGIADDYSRFQAMSCAQQTQTGKAMDVPVIEIRPGEKKATAYLNNALVRDYIANGRVEVNGNTTSFIGQNGKKVILAYRGKDNRVEVIVPKNLHDESNTRSYVIERINRGVDKVLGLLERVFQKEIVSELKKFL